MARWIPANGPACPVALIRYSADELSVDFVTDVNKAFSGKGADDMSALTFAASIGRGASVTSPNVISWYLSLAPAGSGKICTTSTC